MSYKPMSADQEAKETASITPGQYDAKVVDCEDLVSKGAKTSGTPMWKLTWLVRNDNDYEVKMFSWVLHASEGYPAVLFRHCCVALGLEPEYMSGKVDATMPKGRTCMVQVVHKDGDQYPTIRDYVPVDDGFQPTSGEFSNRQNPAQDKKDDYEVPF